jgi:hypothetical protein
MRLSAFALGGGGYVLFVVFANMRMLGLAFLLAILCVAAACALFAVSVGEPPRSLRYVLLSSTMGVLAGLAPISLVVFLRLSRRMCAVANTLGLPSPEPWREIAHWGGGLIWLASTVFLVLAVRNPRLRNAAIAMWIWSALIALPTFFFYFLTVFGDPGPNCLPV